MDKVIAAFAGILCGVGQFFVLRHSLKPLAEGKLGKLWLGMLLRLPIPFVLLLGCAWIDAGLLPFAGVAFCLSIVLATLVYQWRKRERGD